MEDSYYHGKSQRLVSDMGSPTPQTQPNPSKFCCHFLYKAVLVTVLFVILPLFPSQAPEFINHSVLTRSWELFHLLFVGIAVSYGLFSRRNVEIEKENQSKIDNAQNYVSRIFHVSSVFDDDVDSPSGSDDNKIQTWNSRCFRGETMIVEQESSIPDEQTSTVTKFSNKPLFLPVRSLKSKVSDSEDSEALECNSLSRSSSGSRSSSSGAGKTWYGDIGDVDPVHLEERLQENVVLPSPIPWRSRSGRMEMKEEPEFVTPPPYSLPPSADEAEIERDELQSRSFQSPMSWSFEPNSTSESPKKHSPSPCLPPSADKAEIERDRLRSRSLRLPMSWSSQPNSSSSTLKKLSSSPCLPPSADKAEIERDRLRSPSFQLPMSWSSQPNSTSPSPKKLSPSPSLSPELPAKNIEDSVTKMSHNTSSSHSPPPPPPVSCESPLITSNSCPASNGNSSQKMEMEKGFKDELKDVRSSRGGMRRRSDPGLDALRSEVKSGAHTEGISVAKSVRTLRMSEPIAEARKTRDYNGESMEEKTGKKSEKVEPMFIETTGRRALGAHTEGISMAKSVRTHRMSEPIAEARKTRDYNGERMEEKTGKKSKEVESMFMETPRRRAGGFKQRPINNEKTGQESPRQTPKSQPSKYPVEEKKEFLDKVILETKEDLDGDTEVEADETQGSSDKEEAASDTVTDAGFDSEVDKKAAEFIAKFREQIRLQRIESIKRGSGKDSGRTSLR